MVKLSCHQNQLGIRHFAADYLRFLSRLPSTRQICVDPDALPDPLPWCQGNLTYDAFPGTGNICSALAAENKAPVTRRISLDQ